MIDCPGSVISCASARTLDALGPSAAEGCGSPDAVREDSMTLWLRHGRRARGVPRLDLGQGVGGRVVWRPTALGPDELSRAVSSGDKA